MLRVIPAIDVIDSQVVRLRQGNYQDIQFYSESVLDLAFRYQDMGFKSIHLVNLSGAKDLKTRLDKIIEQLLIQCNLSIQVGGGIRSIADMERFMNLGIDRIVIGSLLIEKPELVKKFIDTYSNITIIAALDVLSGTIRSHAWQSDSGQTVNELIPDLVQMGINEFLITDISRDGMLNGIDGDFYLKIRDKFPSIKIIASGGVSCSDDLETLDVLGIDACVIGKALIEKKMRVPKPYLGVMNAY